MEFTVQNICGFLIRSRLMTADEMKAMSQRWAKESEPNASLAQFTKWLAANQYVTEYQAGLLAKGHGEPEVYFLNQYRILDRLGRGRMAGVYKAMHTLGQTVAIKVLPPSQAKNAQMLGRFQREARLSLRLKHPNVVRSFQVGEAAGLNFLVMEFLEGETFEEVLARRKTMPPNEAVRLIHQALAGLQHIHEQGMVHRDLKPSNLMLVPDSGNEDAHDTSRATVKILDIGLGRELFEDKVGTPGANAVELTAEGVLLGTPDYLAPEQARDPRSIDIRADIYSLGCVLYHALTGQPPFPDKNLLNQMVRHATEPPRPLQEFNPAIPDGLQQIMNWMLAKQPAQRYPSPERAAQALQVFLLADSQAPHSIDEEPKMRKYLTWLESGGNNEDTLPPRVEAPNPGRPALPAMPLPTPAVAERKKVQATPAPPSRPPGGKKPKKKGGEEPRIINVPVAKAYASPPAPFAAPVEEFDVELVALPTPLAVAAPAAELRKGWLGLSKREWLLIGIGGGVVLALVVIGVVIGSMLSSGSP